MRGPPVSGKPLHLLLRDKLGKTMRQPFAATGRNSVFLQRSQVQDVDVVIAHVGDAPVVRSELGVEDRSWTSWQLANGAGGALHHEQLSGKANEDEGAILGEMKIGEAA